MTLIASVYLLVGKEHSGQLVLWRQLEATIGPEWTSICFVLDALHSGRECKLAYLDNIA